MKDYYLEVKVKNGILKQLLDSKGMSLLGLSRESGAGYHALLRLANLTIKNPSHPLTYKNLKRVGDYFGVTPESLLPPEMWDGGLEVNNSGRYISYDEINSAIDQSESTPIDDFVKKERISFVDNAIGKILTEKEREVIQMRFWDGMTLRDVAKEFDLTTERIRQIEGKAMRKLRGNADRYSLDKLSA